MEFLKKFFNDDSVKVGLCSFKQMKPSYCQASVVEDVFFNPLATRRIYQTDFSKNNYLSR